LKPFIIGVAGGSGSGKTTIVRHIQERCAAIPMLTLQLDHYYRDLAHLSPEERNQVNFDHPESLEMGLVVDHLRTLAAGQSVNRPTYEFASHTRSSKVVQLDPMPVILVDGIFALYDANIRSILDCGIYVDVCEDIRFIRRLRRDVGERGRSNESVINQYLATVKPMYDMFVAPTKQLADFVIYWDRFNERTIHLLSSMIQESTRKN
jgi:uridine kinase